MKMLGFQVKKFRSIQDSGPVKIEDLTVLVGKNESGKTSLLKALHKFKPARQEPYNINREWPRGDRKTRDPSHVVCRVTFEFETGEKDELAPHVDDQTTLDLPFEIGRSYNGNYTVFLDAAKFPDRPPRAAIDAKLDALEQAHGTFPAAVGPNLTRCYPLLRNLARDGKFDELANSAELIRSTLLPPGGHTPSDEDEKFVAQLTGAVTKLAGELKAARTIAAHVGDFAKGKIPTFIYMDDYRAFSGTALIDQVKGRKDQSQLTEEDRTLMMIMELSGLDIESEFKKAQATDLKTKEERVYDLNDAGLTLSKEIENRWGQKRYEVKYQADGNSFFTMVCNEDSPELIPLEDRSKGFQWFFSFDLLFMYESKGTFKGCVLLLDEPGLHLHPDGQTDLIKRLEAYARSNVLIYTTHLPFMINLREPSRIRTISETEKLGTVVDPTLNLSQPEARLTLQAALGMSATTSYLVAQRNLIVEGVDDYWIISELSNLLIRSGEEGLPDDLHITAAGGASEAAYIATFMIGQKLDVVALFDSDQAGDDAADHLLKNWLTRYASGDTKVLRVGAAIERKEETGIEDLFPADYYLDRVKKVYAKQLIGKDELKLRGSGQLVKSIERAFDAVGLTYNKGSVAKIIRGELSRAKTLDAIPPQTVALGKKLIAAINGALAKGA